MTPINSTTSTPPRGRFAPSPSGRMHLGNIFTALMSWLSVKSREGEWILRIEDLDPQRSKPEFVAHIESDLEWLGLEWDEGGSADMGPHAPYSQSSRGDLYESILGRLEATGLTYPCYCTRADIMATQAPHQSDGRVVYAGTCRISPPAHPTRKPSTRLTVDDTDITFSDAIAGIQSFNLARECGDFILRRADGAWAYQLAVVADDADMQISEVMRGNDLLLSAAQQIWLYSLLNHKAPEFAHLPLICNAEGLRLSKRDNSLSMEALRQHMSAKEIIGRLACIAGLPPEPIPMTPNQLIPLFSISKLRELPQIIRINPAEFQSIPINRD